MADEKSNKEKSEKESKSIPRETPASGAPKSSTTLQSPAPADFSVLNLETNESVIVQADMDLDDGWDLLISSGSGNLGPSHASGGSGSSCSSGSATYGK